MVPPSRLWAPRIQARWRSAVAALGTWWAEGLDRWRSAVVVLGHRWARVPSWAQRAAVGVGILLIGLLVLGVLSAVAYGTAYVPLNWPEWTGFNTYATTQRATESSTATPIANSTTKVTITEQMVHYKTLWDWLQLLIVPAALAGATVQLNRAQSVRAEHIAKQNQREAAFQAYLDRMKELLIVRGLRTSLEIDEVRPVARALTLAVLRELDGERKGSLVRFLYESSLIMGERPILKLNEADLQGIYLQEAQLQGANLVGAYLYKADLSGADLRGASLAGVHLHGALLHWVNLQGVNLQWARFDSTTAWPQGFNVQGIGALHD